MDTIGADQDGRLAQWLERLLHTQEVTGSSPVLPTILHSYSPGLGGISQAPPTHSSLFLTALSHNPLDRASALVDH